MQKDPGNQGNDVKRRLHTFQVVTDTWVGLGDNIDVEVAEIQMRCRLP